MEKKNRWEEDCFIYASRDTRAKLKIQAAVRGLTVKEFLAQIAEEKGNEKKGYK